MTLKNSKTTPPDSKPVRKSRKQKKNRAEDARKDELTIVGIGGSSGGLKALQAFFDALPHNTGMAYVVVTHLHPEHESHMAEILQSHTRMPVQQAVDTVAMEADHVYVIPPNRNITVADSHLSINEFDEPRGHRTPIDLFFRSLASGHHDAIAIILSGGGTDGAVGIKAIKEMGGMLMVQHPDEAEHDGMPRAAIATGLADVVLPADLLAGKLVEYARRRPQLPRDEDELTSDETETVQRILAQVQARTGHDFSQYKRSTILRRIERRMQLNGFTTLEAYLGYLRPNVPEAVSMFNDILIGVTNFFRDPEAWQSLTEKVLPKLFESKGVNDTIRVWTIGCATGEEAYSTAILFFEYAALLGIRPNVQVFASDLDENSVTHAREGLYPTAIETDVSPERLERFFTREGDHYRVKRELRDAMLFTNHNVLRDPPFSRQDVISCRNLLIYLQRAMQDNVFDTFHYSLKPGGYLFLGNSESAEALHELFSVIDKTHRIYQAKPWAAVRPNMPSLPLSIKRDKLEPYVPIRPHRPGRSADEPSVLDDKHRRALEGYSPPSILVDENYAILHISETAGRYLLQPKGPITSDLLKLVRPELQLELRGLLFHAFEKNKAVVSRPVPVQFNGHARGVVLSVRPRLEDPEQGRGSAREALVVFLENELDEHAEFIVDETTEKRGGAQDQRIAQLETETLRLREQLQVTVEEYESSNEEMKAANEELQSINEEFRSAMEELETSKEELQSLNEELQTVNSELKNRLEEILRANSDLENLISVTEIATIFLDSDLRIRRYTPPIEALFNIMPTDRGRPVAHLTHKLAYNQFAEDAAQVLRTLAPLEREVAAENGQWFIVRVHPYRRLDNRIDGVVTSFVDITKLKAAEQTQREIAEKLEERVRGRTRELDDTNRRLSQARDRFFRLFHVNPIPTSIARLEDGTFIDVNEAYLDFCGLTREEIIDHTSEELKLPLAPEIRPGLIARVQKEGLLRNIQLDITLPSGEAKTILASLQHLNFAGTDALMLAFNDITERVRIEQEVRTVASNMTSAEQAERTRIARILHDDLQQNIFAVKMQLSMLRDSMEKNGDTSRVDLAQLDEWLADAIATTRQLSVDLSPPILQGEGLTEAVIWLGVQMKEQYDLEVTVLANGVHAVFEEDVRLLVFQAVRELLFNVVKHSETTRATVTFKQLDGEVSIMVSDDGKGFDAEQVMENWKTRHGLLRLRDRLFLLGCNLKINSAPNDGTRITVEAPTKSL